MRTSANHERFFLFVFLTLALSNNAHAAETDTKSVCDTKILGRPGCEVGDFDLERDRRSYQMQIIEIRRKIRSNTLRIHPTPEELGQPDYMQDLINRVRGVFPRDVQESNGSEKVRTIQDFRLPPAAPPPPIEINPDKINHETRQKSKPAHQSGRLNGNETQKN